MLAKLKIFKKIFLDIPTYKSYRFRLREDDKITTFARFVTRLL